MLHTFEVLVGPAASVPSKLRNDEKRTWLPSGDHKGKELSAFGAVALLSGIRSVPSARTRHTFLAAPALNGSSKLRSDSNTSSFPSGDHRWFELCASSAVDVLNAISPVPSDLIRQRLNTRFTVTNGPSSFRLDKKAIWVPSGDHLGSNVATVPDATRSVSVVNGINPVPSDFTRHKFSASLGSTELVPSRLRVEMNAISVPSGAHWKEPIPTVAAVTLVNAFNSVRSGLIRHMLNTSDGMNVSPPSRARLETNAICDPSGDHAGAKLPTKKPTLVVNGMRSAPLPLTRQMFTF